MSSRWNQQESWQVRDLPRPTAKPVKKILVIHHPRLRSGLTVDDLVAIRTGAFDATGQAGKTYDFFTSGNGYMRGEHGSPRGRRVPDEESARAPPPIVGLGMAAGRVRQRLVGE